MTFHYNSSLYKRCQYPYSTKDRVMVGEDHVDFSYQFVKRCCIEEEEYNYEYKYENIANLMDSFKKITGPPSKFPNHGDFSETLVMRNNGLDISISPWEKEPYVLRKPLKPQDKSDIHCNYIDLEFHEAVYPIRISIYEVYNPGCVTQILARDSDKRWSELWSGQPQIVPSTSRTFSPPLQSCYFKTNRLRLKFMFSYWDYSTHLNAVELIGTSKLILPKNPEQSLTNLLKCINWKYPCHEDIHNLTPDHKSAYLDILKLQKKFLEYCIICKRDIANSFDESQLEHKVPQEKDVLFSKQGNMNYHSLRDNSNYSKLLKNIELYWNKSKDEQPRCNFSALPEEMVFKIFENLDIRSLCRMSRVNKRLYNLTRNSSLFKSLNLRNMRYMHSISVDNIISHLEPICKSLQQLDLTSSDISVSHFVKFLNGRRLTHLRLRNCQFVNNSVLFEISKICKKLKVLDLSYCYNNITDDGFSYLEDLELLEVLNLKCTNITRESVCKILQKNRRMRDLNLGILSGICSGFDEHSDTVAVQLRNSCPDLEVIDLSGNAINSRGIDALAGCKNLRKLNISFMYPCDDCKGCGPIDKRSLRRLFSSCQFLEEINLMGLFGNFVEELTFCKNLKQVHLDLADNYKSLAILEQCPKLQTIYLNDIYGHGCCFVPKLLKKYPHLSIYGWTEFEGFTPIVIRCTRP